MKYTYTIKDFNADTGYATVVYKASTAGLPVVETPVYFGSTYGTPQAGIEVAKNAPISYWASLDPAVLPTPTTTGEFVIDPNKPPPQ